MLPGITPALMSAASPGNDSYTVLLLHFDGPNSSTVMPDSSPQQHGNAAVAGGCYLIAGGVIGGAALVNPANGYIAFPNSSDWEFGAGDFTVDWWEYRNVAAGCAVARDLTTTYCPFLLHFGANGEIYMTSTGSNWDIANGAAGLPAPGFGPATLTVWNHFAVTRQGNTFRAFKNGVQKSTWTSSLTIKSNANPLCIGAAQNGQNCNSFMDELRISKGIARWTANFTPPTRAYAPDYKQDTNTKLLLHMDGVGGQNSFPDASPYARAVTSSGSTQITNNPYVFGGGSGYFDGTGDYLSCADSPDWNFTGDFTIDFWVRLFALPTDRFAFASHIAGGTDANTRWVLVVWSNGAVTFDSYNAGVQVASASTALGALAPLTWAHVAVVRSGGTISIYINGVQSGGEDHGGAAIPTISGPLRIGVLDNLANWCVNGCIDELRISGVARWSGNFSPPSSPYNNTVLA